MRFESLVWTVMVLLMVGSAALEGDTLGGGVSSGGREYQAADGEIKVPPPLMDPGSTTTAPAQFAK